jgi:hypothetical protein
MYLNYCAIEMETISQLWPTLEMLKSKQFSSRFSCKAHRFSNIPCFIFVNCNAIYKFDYTFFPVHIHRTDAP